MVIDNYFKRLYAAYFTNAKIWVVRYSGGWYCNELCTKIEARFITSKCKGSRMYIYDHLNRENKISKRAPFVFFMAVSWNISMFSVVYLSQIIVANFIIDDRQKALDLANLSFKYWLMALGVWHQLKGAYKYFKS